MKNKRPQVKPEILRAPVSGFHLSAISKLKTMVSPGKKFLCRMLIIFFFVTIQFNAYCSEDLVSIQLYKNTMLFIGFNTNRASLIDNIKSENKERTTLRMEKGLADSSYVSFGFPLSKKSYLRHQDGEIRLTPYEDDTLFKGDATFIEVPGLADPGNPDLVSFKASNIGDMFIVNKDWKLFVAGFEDTMEYKENATFRIVAPNWDGTNPTTEFHDESIQAEPAPKELSNFLMLLVLGTIAIALNLVATRYRDKAKGTSKNYPFS
jgi:hypothetical protein